MSEAFDAQRTARIAKLPVWAREEIREKESRIAELEAMVDRTRIVTTDQSAPGYHIGSRFREHFHHSAHQGSRLVLESGMELNLIVTHDRVDILQQDRLGRELIVHPRAANALALTHKDRP